MAQAATDQHGISAGAIGAIVVIIVVIAAISSASERPVQITVSRGEVGSSLVAAVIVVVALLLVGYAVVNVWAK